jgi:O-antigen/teichoic acid export membrane protein
MKQEANRILSTTLANWLQIILIIVGNLLIIPLILNSWNANLLGIWMIMISLSQFIIIVNLSHQSYLFNSAFILGVKKKFLINKEIISALPISLFFCILLIFFLFISYKFNLLSNLLNIDNGYSKQFNLSILYLAITYLLTYCYGHFFSGIISVTGYLHIFSWTKVLRSFLNLIMPAFAIYSGFEFVEAVYVLIISEFLSFAALFIFVLHQLKKLRFKIYKPNIKNGLKIFKLSILILVNNLIDFIKNIGLRLILTSVLSPVYVSYFVTLRIFSNFIKFFIDSLREPFFPKIMTSLKRNKKNEVLNLIEFYWLISLFIICPLLILIQFFLPFVFEIWTLGKINFHPVLFSLLIMGILIYSLYVPFDIILRGFNENEKILRISLFSLMIFLMTFFLLINIFSLTSIGISILITEILTLISYLYFIRRFLKKKKIYLNLFFFKISNLFIFNTSIILFLIAIYDLDLELILYFILTYCVLLTSIRKVCSNGSLLLIKNLGKSFIK